jgi:hypothetical protein
VKEALRGWLRELDALPRAELARRMTLVSLLLAPVGRAWTRPAIALLCAAGLLLASVRASALFWAALLALAAWRVASAWPLGDNHGYLLCYWLLAACIAMRARDGDAVLAWNGRVLVGLVFAFATLWKVALSPDYLDGRFFALTLVDDARLEAFTRLVAGVDADTLDALRALVREHQDGLRPPQPDDPALPARLRAVALALTWSLVALEAAVAASFLVPVSWRLARARDALLLAFCAGVYALAPVEGFGWLLLAMGVAQCEPHRVWTRRGYAAVFAWVLLASRWPWLRALVG